MDAATVQFEASILDRLLVAAESAQAVLSIRFSSPDEERMRHLMERNNQGTISEEERAEMEAYRRIGSFLAIAHAKAHLQLRQSSGS
jgi:hypothetical protein